MTRVALAVAVASLSALSVAEAQPTGKVYRIALASTSGPVAAMTEEHSPAYKAFFSELRRLRYVEGQNLVVDRRSAEGRTEHYANLAREVVESNPDVICTFSGRMIRAFKAVTTTIPVVGITGDPVADGLVASLSRPGGNITGVSFTAGVIREHLEPFLKEVSGRGDGDGLPRFVEQEFRKFLTCGVLAHGFTRPRCADCAFERLRPLSCKPRAVTGP
jgi:ABC-type uncharacterized transport system substrate-binding protein